MRPSLRAALHQSALKRLERLLLLLRDGRGHLSMGGGGGGGGRETGHCAEGGGGFSEHMASLHMTHWRREESNNACQTELGLNTHTHWSQVTTTLVYIQIFSQFNWYKSLKIGPA